METLPIFSIKEFETRDEEFYVNRLDEHLAHHHFIHEPHKHDFYICVLFTQGKGNHEINFKNYAIKPGSVFFLKPGDLHNWSFNTPVNGFIFFHSKAFYDLNFQNRKLHDFPFYFSVNNPPFLQLELDNQKKLSQLFKQLKENKKEDQYTAIQRASIVDIIYIELSRHYGRVEYSEKVNTSYLVKLQNFEDLVTTYFRVEKSPHFYADKLNISVKHLNRIVKESLNVTASNFIAQIVILEAKKMLIHSDYRVVEIANKLGYEDSSYFIRFFKKHVGITPSKFSY